MTSDANLTGPQSPLHREASGGEPVREVVTFGEFSAHLHTGELFRAGVVVKIQLQPFRVLASLLRRPGELVTRDELRREVWGEHTAVDFEHGLNFCIKQVRAALGDNADEPLFVETLPRRGYRFIAQVARTNGESARGDQTGRAREASSASHRDGPADGARTDGARADGARALATAIAASHGDGEPAAPGSDVHASGDPALASPKNKALPWLLAIGGVALSFTLAAAILRVHSTPPPPPPPVLLVLPFENLTGESDRQVWCDGLTDETIADLAAADPAHLQVIARTTSMAYRGTKKTLRDVGGEVKAEYALEGAVHKDGAGLRVTAQLYRVREEKPVWAQAFEEAGLDLVGDERRLASQLATSLAVRLGPERASVAPSAEAQGALAKARYLRNKHDADALLPSLAAYEEAVKLDPTSGRAWSELAMTYQDAALGALPASEAMSKSCAAAERGAAQSPQEALADTALGLCALQRDWDGAGAARAFESAIAKNPGLAAAHHAYAAFLSAAGRHEEALRAIERAKSLDPLSPAIVADAGWHAYLARNYPAAIREFEHTLELEPDDKWAREHLMIARALAGDATGAAREAVLWTSMFPLSEDTKRAVAAVAPAEIVARASSEIAKWLASRDASGKGVNPGFVAAKFAAAREKEPTLQWLERAASERAPWFLPLLHDPRFDFVFKEPRFTALVTQVRVSGGAHPR